MNEERLFDIPEGWVQVVPLQKTFIIHPVEYKILEEDKLLHWFIFVTDLCNFRVFDRVTGEFKKHRKLRKKQMFAEMEKDLSQYDSSYKFQLFENKNKQYKG